MLDLSGNEIGADGAKSIRPHPAHLTSIQLLDFRHNGICADGADSLRFHLSHLTSEQLQEDGASMLEGGATSFSLSEICLRIPFLSIIDLIDHRFYIPSPRIRLRSEEHGLQTDIIV